MSKEKLLREIRFGSYLKELRISKQVKIREVAEATGIGLTTMYDAEKQKKAITSPELLQRLAKYFNVDMMEFLTRLGYFPYNEDNSDANPSVA